MRITPSNSFYAFPNVAQFSWIMDAAYRQKLKEITKQKRKHWKARKKAWVAEERQKERRDHFIESLRQTGDLKVAKPARKKIRTTDEKPKHDRVSVATPAEHRPIVKEHSRGLKMVAAAQYVTNTVYRL